MTWICEVTGNPTKAKDCIECARQCRVPECPVRSPGLLKALARSLHEDESLAAVKAIAQVPVIRVSSLTGCLRKAWYATREEYPPEKPSQMWARLRGIIFHRGLENGEQGEEMRLFARVAGGIIAGRVDHYDEQYSTLYDYKTINSYKPLSNFDLPKPSHVRQLHLYAWLLARHGNDVRRIVLTYMTMGEQIAVEAPLPDFERVEQEVLEAVEAITAPTPPPAQPRENWECRYCPWQQCPAHPDHSDEDEDIFA